MRVVAVIALFTLVAAILMVGFAIVAPERLIPAIPIASAITGGLFSLLLVQIAPQWRRRRAVLTAALPLPGLLAILAIAFDVTGYLIHLSHPDEPFMTGLSPMLVPVCMVGALAGLIVAVLVRR